LTTKTAPFPLFFALKTPKSAEKSAKYLVISKKSINFAAESRYENVWLSEKSQYENVLNAMKSRY